MRVEIQVTSGRARATVFGLLTLACLPWPATGQEPAAEHRTGEHRVPIISRDGAVYVRARVNGNSALLLVDTGAVLTTFSLKVVPTQETGSRITINMAKGSVLAFRLSVGFTLGERTYGRNTARFVRTQSSVTLSSGLRTALSGSMSWVRSNR